MLPRTFVHLPGIGKATEKRLWDRGIDSWNGLRGNATYWFRGQRLDEVHRLLDETEAAWDRRDLSFFYRHLPRHELWRLVPGFLDQIAFLDIETDGLKFPPVSQSTTITFYFRGQVHQAYEPAQKEQLLRDILDSASVICTYFGEIFDVPFLSREYGIPIDKAQIDLCFWLKRLGYSGGLKRVQKCFEDIPSRSSLDIDGFDAVRLWWMHRRGVRGALETLLAYNAEDTVVLEALLIKAYNLEVDNHPHLPLSKYEMRPFPKLPTEIDPNIYHKLREHQASSC